MQGINGLANIVGGFSASNPEDVEVLVHEPRVGDLRDCDILFGGQFLSTPQPLKVDRIGVFDPRTTENLFGTLWLVTLDLAG